MAPTECWRCSLCIRTIVGYLLHFVFSIEHRVRPVDLSACSNGGPYTGNYSLVPRSGQLSDRAATRLEAVLLFTRSRHKGFSFVKLPPLELASVLVANGQTSRIRVWENTGRAIGVSLFGVSVGDKTPAICLNSTGVSCYRTGRIARGYYA